MNMKLVMAPASSTQMGNSKVTDRRGRTRKLNPKTQNLPLPPDPEYFAKWGKVFVPQLYAWAGSTNDPFGANAKMAGEVEVIWKHVFPDVDIDETDRYVVLKVVRVIFCTLKARYNLGVFRLEQRSTTGIVRWGRLHVMQHSHIGPLKFRLSIPLRAVHFRLND